MKSDLRIQKDVMEQLLFEPFLNSSEIGVAVKNGIVTLSGQVDSYAKKVSAENAAKKVSGLKAIAEDIQIGVYPRLQKTDAEIAQAVVTALQWHSAVQEEKIKIKVENGNVLLEGEVDWEYEKASAASSVEVLSGVRSVTNLITVKPKVVTSDVREKINLAFKRSATIDAAKVKVEVEGNMVTLRGKVRSFAEKQDAERTAWNAPGVTIVESKLQLEQPEFAF